MYTRVHCVCVCAAGERARKEVRLSEVALAAREGTDATIAHTYFVCDSAKQRAVCA